LGLEILGQFVGHFLFELFSHTRMLHHHLEDLVPGLHCIVVGVAPVLICFATCVAPWGLQIPMRIKMSLIMAFLIERQVINITFIPFIIGMAPQLFGLLFGVVDVSNSVKDSFWLSIVSI
jgi:hypothetical protein